jgi:hypothetical protein
MATRRIAKDTSVHKQAVEALPEWLASALTSIDPSDALNPIGGVISTGTGLLGKLAKVFRRKPQMPVHPPIQRPYLPEFAAVGEEFAGTGASPAIALDDIAKLRGEAAYQRVRAAGGKPTPTPHPANPSNPGDKILREHELPGKDKPVKRKEPK